MDSVCAFPRLGSAASLRVGRTSRGVPTGKRADVLACGEKRAEVEGAWTSGVDQVVVASGPADDRAGACGRQPSSSMMDELTFVFGADVDLVLTSRGIKNG